jgi:hypothetical protein
LFPSLPSVQKNNLSKTINSHKTHKKASSHMNASQALISATNPYSAKVNFPSKRTAAPMGALFIIESTQRPFCVFCGNWIAGLSLFLRLRLRRVGLFMAMMTGFFFAPLAPFCACFLDCGSAWPYPYQVTRKLVTAVQNHIQRQTLKYPETTAISSTSFRFPFRLPIPHPF